MEKSTTLKAGIADVVKSKSETERSYDYLSDEIERLDDRIIVLKDKLSAILRPQIPEEKKLEEDVVFSALLPQKINEKTSRIRYMFNSINDILNRLEL